MPIISSVFDFGPQGVLENVLLGGRSPSVSRFKLGLQMLLYSLVENSRFLEGKRRVVHSWNAFR